jgi:hypothetical protein
MPRKLLFCIPVLIAFLAITSFSDPVSVHPTTFPTFGISFAAPSDATFELTDTPTHIGLYRFNPNSPNAGAAILVEVSSAKGGTVEAISKSISARLKANDVPGPFTIGGEKADKLTADFHVDSFTTRVTYLVVHQDRLYIFSALNSANADASQSLDSLVASVKFPPVQSPLKCTTDFFDKPFEVFGCFSMNGPSFMRRTDNQPTLLHLGVYDYTTNANSFNIDIQRIQTPPKSFADIRDAYSTAIQTKLASPDPLAWHVQKGLPGLNVSQPISCTVQAADGTTSKAINRFCILELAPGDFVQILFTITDTTADADIKTYTDLSDKMLATIKVLPSKPH